ncbi:hypothetical protein YASMINEVIRUS_64 [Yasminevirus sp. GU-2018]|uniref:Uncharacterized protein n=1 Tax=Yasminevirus sp. GU-2018 TaxID=2420051 RepID=A0A5K0U7Y5_9VIRU|nr:hypothetical protein YASMINEVIRUS_64 [Yasminevirus sp. GU-2018]
MIFDLDSSSDERLRYDEDERNTDLINGINFWSDAVTGAVTGAVSNVVSEMAKDTKSVIVPIFEQKLKPVLKPIGDMYDSLFDVVTGTIVLELLVVKCLLAYSRSKRDK